MEQAQGNASSTPGPWSVLEHEGEVFILANGAMQIAEVTYVLEYAGEQGSRRLQNARLMAGAPDLLAALVSLANAFHEGRAANAQLESWGYIGALVLNAEMAIDKATRSAA